MLRMTNLSKVYRTHMIETHALRGFEIHVNQGHRRRLRDKRTGERHQRQPEPGQRQLGTHRQALRQGQQHALHGFQHRARSRHHHYDEHE